MHAEQMWCFWGSSLASFLHQKHQWDLTSHQKREQISYHAGRVQMQSKQTELMTVLQETTNGLELGIRAEICFYLFT